MKKSRKRLCCLSQLKRSGLKTPELIQFYRTCIHPITEYACPVFHDCLPAYQLKGIESIQRHAMRISFPSLSYEEALDEAGLISLSIHHQFLTEKLFTKVTMNREKKLHHFLPEQRTCHYNLRKQQRFKPVFETNCCKSKTSFEKNCFSAWASTLNMGLINKVDMVCLLPVGYGV